MPDPTPEFLALQQALAGRFTLERELGRGGMGLVYLARDVALDRLVAIKLLPVALAGDESRMRFLREARTAAGLSHPNIVPIHLVEQSGDLVYYVMAYVEGESLGARVRRAGPLPAAEVARVVREAAWALAYAHGRGIVHRDVKPDNIMLERGSGRALVMDFGIARVQDASSATVQGQILGSLPFLSPEQASPGAPLDGRSDLYSLGVTAFYALTGRLPFEGDTAHALIAQHLTEPAPRVALLRPGLPVELAAAVDRCLAKRPDERFASGEALAEALGASAHAGSESPAVVRRMTESAMVALSIAPILAMALGIVLTESPEEAMAILPLLLGLMAIAYPLEVFLTARRLVAAGHTAEDVGAAAVARVQEVAILQPRSLKGWMYRAERGLRGRAILIGLGVLTGGITLLVPWLIWDGLKKGILYNPLGLIFAGLFVGGLSVLAFLKARVMSDDPEVELARDQLRVAKATRWLFGGPLMRGFLRMVGWTVPRREIQTGRSPEETLREAVLAAFAQLPPDLVRRLRGLPPATRSLESAVARLRARQSELAALAAEAGSAAAVRRGDVVAELDGARDAARMRLEQAMTALENLRLDLLRLRAGTAPPDALTGAIERAEAIGREVDGQLGR